MSFSTCFNPLGESFLGVGVSVSSTPSNSVTVSQLQPLSNSTFKFVKVITGIQDPGIISDTGPTFFDSLWSTWATDNTNVISFLSSLGIHIVLQVDCPVSWLVSGYLTGSNSLNLYASLLVSAFNCIQNLQPDIIHSVILFNEPDHSCYPNDLVTLAFLVKSRSISIKLVGPSNSSVPSITSTNTNVHNLYRLALSSFPDAFEFLDIHAVENPLDSNIIDNSNSIDARRYIQFGLQHDSVSLSSIQPIIPKICSNLYTIASLQGLAFTLRIADNIIDALYNSFSIIILPIPIDEFSSPVFSLLSKISSTLPTPGILFQSQSADESPILGSLVMSTDSMSFCFMFSIAGVGDPLDDKLSITVVNPIWNTGYYLNNLQFTSFPDSNTVPFVVSSNIFEGSAIIVINNVPTNCVLFLSGNLQLVPPPVVVVPPSSPLPDTLVQVTLSFGIPTGVTPEPGTIYFDSQLLSTRVFDSTLGWINTKTF